MGENRFLYRGIKYNIFGLIPKTSYVTQTLNIKYRGTIEPWATYIRNNDSWMNAPMTKISICSHYHLYIKPACTKYDIIIQREKSHFYINSHSSQNIRHMLILDTKSLIAIYTSINVFVTLLCLIKIHLQIHWPKIDSFVQTS